MKKMIAFLIIFLFPFDVFAITCNNCIVMDMDSGRILYENNKDNKMLIAFLI